MKNTENLLVAGLKSQEDWKIIRVRLLLGDTNAWRDAFTDFYEARLDLRYLHPIDAIRKGSKLLGEGFSIATIQCSLIEFLESTELGINYRYVRRRDELGEHEYNSSSEVFISFLTSRIPFSATFDIEGAEDFYIGVRCALLHEARTKNGWRILAKSEAGLIADVNNRIFYRDNFQNALRVYIDDYGSRLSQNFCLQEAFIRKFDSLCE